MLAASPTSELSCPQPFLLLTEYSSSQTTATTKAPPTRPPKSPPPRTASGPLRASPPSSPTRSSTPTASPSGQTLYLSDTGAASGSISPFLPLSPRRLRYNTTDVRTVYAYDVSADGLSLANPRPFYRAIDFMPDGLKIAANGYVVTTTGHGLDVLDEDGALVVRVQAGYPVMNFQWTDLQRGDVVDGGGRGHQSRGVEPAGAGVGVSGQGWHGSVAADERKVVRIISCRRAIDRSPTESVHQPVSKEGPVYYSCIVIVRSSSRWKSCS
ncbi:hypothetical protein MMC17_000863 [Xylographa soralifera]|nr:hypothetical protein [Xylographa soralifera]